MILKNAFPIVALMLLTLSAFSCSSGENNDEDPNKNLLGPGGGSYEVTNDLKLKIPAGAVSEEVTLSFTEISPPASDTLVSVGRFYKIEPSDVTFSKAATLTIKYRDTAIPKDRQANEIHMFSKEDDLWRVLDGGVDEGTLSVQGSIIGLGTFGPAMTPSGNNNYKGAKIKVVEDLDIGVAVIGQGKFGTLHISNEGDKDLDINEVIITPKEAFSIDGQAPSSVDPGKVANLSIKFVPTFQQVYDAKMTIKSSDTINPSVEIALSGRGSGGATAAIIENKLDFAEVKIGSYKDLELKVTNISSAGEKLLIYNIDLGTDVPFTLEETTLPVTIDAESSHVFTFRFMPKSEGFVSSDIYLYMDDVDNEKWEIEFSGKGVTEFTDGDEEIEDEIAEQE